MKDRDGEPIVITDTMIKEYTALSLMSSKGIEAVGCGGITVLSCFINGADTAREQGFAYGTADYENARLYYTVLTARCHEVPINP